MYNNFVERLAEYLFNIEVKKWGAYLCTHVLLSISNVSSRFPSTLQGRVISTNDFVGDL